MILYRPLGLRELELIAELDWRAFPPRLDIQPIFYPVLDEGYAMQIARDWNTQDSASGFAGFVTRFEVQEDHASGYEVHVVGASTHRELWIPADELEAFNNAIVGRIEVIAAFAGDRCAFQLSEDGLLPNHLSTKFGG